MIVLPDAESFFCLNSLSTSYSLLWRRTLVSCVCPQAREANFFVLKNIRSPDISWFPDGFTKAFASVLWRWDLNQKQVVPDTRWLCCNALVNESYRSLHAFSKDLIFGVHMLVIKKNRYKSLLLLIRLILNALVWTERYIRWRRTCYMYWKQNKIEDISLIKM